MYIINRKNFKSIGTVIVELLWSPIWKTWFRENRDTKTRHNAQLREALTQRRALYFHFFEFFLEIFTRHS